MGSEDPERSARGAKEGSSRVDALDSIRRLVWDPRITASLLSAQQSRQQRTAVTYLHVTCVFI